ncbi:hypothetical protein IKF92_02895 [Candidatus Saccharibacteria bacterium]|nr:hypothetical protein [Candidatus Saccharibacteria bacterium]
MKAENEVKKKIDLSYHVFFNYLNKTALAKLDDLKKVVEQSNETGNVLLAKLLGFFEENLEDDEMMNIIKRDLYAVTNSSMDRTYESLEHYVTCKPAWEDFTKEEAASLRKAEYFVAENFSNEVLKILMK